MAMIPRTIGVYKCGTGMRAYDVAIVGGGVVGSAAAWQCAARGASAVLLEQFEAGHDRGSSHGESRITRTSIFEHPDYVPLVRRSTELVRQLERETGAHLLTPMPILYLGPEGGELIHGVRESARTHGPSMRELTRADVGREYPQFRVRGSDVVLQEEGGALRPDACLRALWSRARALGAELRDRTRVESWESDGAGVSVVAGETLRARALILAPGAWAERLFQLDAPIHLAVERTWWAFCDAPVDPAAFAPGRFPAFIWDFAPEDPFYGFPDLGHGAKCAFHHTNDLVDPDTPRREVTDAELGRLRARLAAAIPDLAVGFRGSKTCLYTTTRDGHFVLDRHPRHANVVLASPCSGHGFKHAFAVGEVLAELALDGRTRHQVDRFALARLR